MSNRGTRSWLALTLGVAAPALAQQPADDRQQIERFVRHTYTLYDDAKYSTAPSAGVPPSDQTIYTAEMVKAFGKKDWSDGPGEDDPDYDLLCGCDDFGRVTVRQITYTELTADLAKIRVALDNTGMRPRGATVHLVLQKTAAGWRIAEVEHDGNSMRQQFGLSRTAFAPALAGPAPAVGSADALLSSKLDVGEFRFPAPAPGSCESFFSKSFTGRIRSLYATGQHDELRRTIAMTGCGHVFAYAWLADSYFAERRFSPARAYYDRIIALESDDAVPVALRCRGNPACHHDAVASAQRQLALIRANPLNGRASSYPPSAPVDMQAADRNAVAMPRNFYSGTSMAIHGAPQAAKPPAKPTAKAVSTRSPR